MMNHSNNFGWFSRLRRFFVILDLLTIVFLSYFLVGSIPVDLPIVFHNIHT